MESKKSTPATESDAVVKQRIRTTKFMEECMFPKFNKEKIKTICAKHSELIDDFKAVREINTEISMRFEYIIKVMPTQTEIDFMILHGGVYTDDAKRKETKERLTKFKKLVAAMKKYHDEDIPAQSHSLSVDVEEVV